MKRNYWQTRAAPWVSAVVMGGGILISIMLFVLVRAEERNLSSIPAEYFID
jgi:hypothetical protein